MAAGRYLHHMRGESSDLHSYQVESYSEEERAGSAVSCHTRVFGSLSKLQCLPHATEVGGAVSLFSNRLFPGQRSHAVLRRPGEPSLEPWTRLKVEEESIINGCTIFYLLQNFFVCTYAVLHEQPIIVQQELLPWFHQVLQINRGTLS